MAWRGMETVVCLISSPSSPLTSHLSPLFSTSHKQGGDRDRNWGMPFGSGGSGTGWDRDMWVGVGWLPHLPACTLPFACLLASLHTNIHTYAMHATIFAFLLCPHIHMPFALLLPFPALAFFCTTTTMPHLLMPVCLPLCHLPAYLLFLCVMFLSYFIRHVTTFIYDITKPNFLLHCLYVQLSDYSFLGVYVSLFLSHVCSTGMWPRARICCVHASPLHLNRRPCHFCVS